MCDIRNNRDTVENSPISPREVGRVQRGLHIQKDKVNM